MADSPSTEIRKLYDELRRVRDMGDSILAVIRHADDGDLLVPELEERYEAAVKAESDLIRRICGSRADGAEDSKILAALAEESLRRDAEDDTFYMLDANADEKRSLMLSRALLRSLALDQHGFADCLCD